MTKILIIEDDPDLRADVVEGLIFEGYEAVGAVDGVDGINCTMRDPPDLILCDIMMPRLDGYGVLLDLRSNSLTQLTPIIFMTAKVAHDDIRQGMIAGADDYITKPFTHEELLQTIQTRLEKLNTLEEEQQRRAADWQQALKLAREQEMLEAKLMALFSHDFRNRLLSIMTSLNLLREFSGQMDEADRLIYLNRMQLSVRHLLQMLDDARLVAEMERDILRFDPQPLSLDLFVESIVEEFQEIAAVSQQLLYEGSFSGMAIANPHLLRQMITNLISNAIQYSSAGTQVSIRLESTGGQYILKVQDQGIGIPEADQICGFDAFQRGSNVGNIAGIGLGLTIVSQAVALHHGSVRLTSTVGIGTTVTVAIPAM